MLRFRWKKNSGAVGLTLLGFKVVTKTRGIYTLWVGGLRFPPSLLYIFLVLFTPCRLLCWLSVVFVGGRCLLLVVGCRLFGGAAIPGCRVSALCLWFFHCWCPPLVITDSYTKTQPVDILFYFILKLQYSQKFFSVFQRKQSSFLCKYRNIGFFLVYFKCFFPRVRYAVKEWLNIFDKYFISYLSLWGERFRFSSTVGYIFGLSTPFGLNIFYVSSQLVTQ